MALMQRTSSWSRRSRGSLSKKNDDPMGPAAIVADIPKDIEADYSRRIKKLKKKRSSCCSLSRFMLLIIFVLIGGYAYVYYHEREMLKSQLVEQETTMRELEINLSMKFDSEVKKLKDENASLKRKAEDINQQMQISNENLVKQKQDIEQKLTKQKKTLQENIQKMSKAACLEKFGPGPYSVEIHARFDAHDPKKIDQGWILLELAPLDEMPHAVYWFLEQVSRELFNGGSFHRNGGHVIQAGMVTNFLTDPKHPVTNQRFQDAGFGSLMFQEYSPNFPHKKYTLGFLGRPAGPDFYINTKDNIVSHGPGGQSHHEDPTEADVCFAKVKKGFDLVDRIHKLPVWDGPQMQLKDNVAIVSIKIIKNPH